MKSKKNVVWPRSGKKLPATKAARYSVAEMAAIEKSFCENFGEIEAVFHEIVSPGGVDL